VTWLSAVVTNLLGFVVPEGSNVHWLDSSGVNVRTCLELQPDPRFQVGRQLFAYLLVIGKSRLIELKMSFNLNRANRL
jgi:hypothetical protein